VSEKIPVQSIEASRAQSRDNQGGYSQREFLFSAEGNNLRRNRETDRERGVIMTRLRRRVRTATSRASDATAAWRCGSARKGKGIYKGKTVGFSLIWRSFRPFLSPWTEKDIKSMRLIYYPTKKDRAIRFIQSFGSVPFFQVF
jgi:hypothetical protein